MEEFDNYFNLTVCEFYEFLGRLAELIYEVDTPLVEKLTWLLDKILKRFTKEKLQFRSKEGDLETDSDCEDDVVEELKHKILTKYGYE